MNKSENFSTAYYAIIFLILVIFFGAFGYMIMEGYSFTEAFFMTIITISTVGFKEVRPLSETGMWFTSFLIIISFGIFAFAVTTFTRYLVDGVFRNYYRISRLKKKIESLNGHVVICGYGRNGRQAGLDLLEHNVPVVIIEKDEETIEKIRENQNLLYIQGNATHDEVLQLTHLSRAKALITTLPSDADNLLVVLSASEINPDLKIISRASSIHTDRKLKRAGATNVIMPEKIGGQRMAKLVAQPDVVEFLDYIMLQRGKDVNIEEISCNNLSPSFENISIQELNIRVNTGANIIGLKKEDGSYVFNPPPGIKLSKKHQLFVLGTPGQIEKLKEALKRSSI